MIAAREILGLQVPDTSRAFLVVLAVHVCAALAAVFTGAGAALIRKGRGRHSRLGDVYVCSLGAVFATAIVLAVLRWPHDIHLAVLGAIAFTAALTGYLARRRHWPGDRAHILGMGISYITLLTAFYVDNGKQLPLWDRLPTPAYWLLPAMIGVPLIARALRRHRSQSMRRNTA